MNASTKKAVRRSLTARENQIVRDKLQELVNRYGSQTAVAKRLGFGQPSISSFLQGAFNAGPALARSIAEEYGTSVSDLLGWQSSVEKDVYPARAEAIAAGRRVGISESAIDRLKGEKISSLTAIQWLRLLLTYQELIDTKSK